MISTGNLEAGTLPALLAHCKYYNIQGMLAIEHARSQGIGPCWPLFIVSE